MAVIKIQFWKLTNILLKSSEILEHMFLSITIIFVNKTVLFQQQATGITQKYCEWKINKVNFLPPPKKL